jgi:hypothetical protein
MIEVETLNSTYHVNVETKMVRRSEPNTDASHRLSGGEWREYEQIHVAAFHGALIFVWPDGKSTQTSTVVSQREVEAV